MMLSEVHLSTFFIGIISTLSNFDSIAFQPFSKFGSIIEHNLVDYAKIVILIKYLRRAPWCNSSLESERRALNVGTQEDEK